MSILAERLHESEGVAAEVNRRAVLYHSYLAVAGWVSDDLSTDVAYEIAISGGAPSELLLAS